jgi:hypothetical protein
MGSASVVKTEKVSNTTAGQWSFSDRRIYIFLVLCMWHLSGRCLIMWAQPTWSVAAVIAPFQTTRLGSFSGKENGLCNWDSIYAILNNPGVYYVVAMNWMSRVLYKWQRCALMYLIVLCELRGQVETDHPQLIDDEHFKSCNGFSCRIQLIGMLLHTGRHKLTVCTCRYKYIHDAMGRSIAHLLASHPWHRSIHDDLYITLVSGHCIT